MERMTYKGRKRLYIMLIVFSVCLVGLSIRVGYIMLTKADEYQQLAYEQQTRDRLITPKRGSILDRNGVGMALTESVSSVSVIHAQVTDKEGTAKALSQILELDYDEVLSDINERVALKRIKAKVPNEVAEQIRSLNMAGVMIDEDVERTYPYYSMASQVIGFVGKDNQGIIGLESKYEEYLKGETGKILTLTDSKGRRVSDAEERVEPVDGYDLVTSLDVVIQQYAEQEIQAAVEAKSAKSGMIISMNPQNGEIYAMANYPTFDLNDPFTINDDELAAMWDTFTEEEKNDYLNQMWRNKSINDTYEPGSTFKVVTSSAGLEEGVITPESTFNCAGSMTVGGRQIKCWRFPRSHGTQTFKKGVQNSCNCVFMQVAERIGADRFYDYMIKFGFNEKTGIDLNGEAVGILHKKEDIGSVELATMSFGQTFQITPIQLLRAAAAVVNGGTLVTPHFAIRTQDSNGYVNKVFDWDSDKRAISEETSATMRDILESVVAEGTGSKTKIEGYRIGGKTATSQKLPRGSGKYIASFMTFAPADNPTIMTLVLIDEPQGMYYGGSVAGPVMHDYLINILPYMNIEKTQIVEESKTE
ncbi:MAG: penicillin-binding transpeptidase domain-containing protein [Candidatus Metalachnospira sp.]|nr:penicillin-binding transpeptidase domain-containing protein [Candidatus Metalachnospira sp.]